MTVLLMKSSDEYGSATNCLIIRQPVMAAVFCLFVQPY